MVNVEEQFLTDIYTPDFLIQQNEEDDTPVESTEMDNAKTDIAKRRLDSQFHSNICECSNTFSFILWKDKSAQEESTDRDKTMEEVTDQQEPKKQSKSKKLPGWIHVHVYSSVNLLIVLILFLYRSKVNWQPRKRRYICTVC